ncbi:hypothetical protein AG1IA_07127 [Rhizoctonia solani AG-1 IA]|uniref:Uncharacterized protein n=1 Tax=Thanatephorus cucumeris (strain AG1-IA) TaxID=983506 RepID=L8WQ02_THACA|nr:hypothetical protein AG1IA_07127 [Rhizoctonia solani AG-1 IA]
MTGGCSYLTTQTIQPFDFATTFLELTQSVTCQIWTRMMHSYCC